MRKQIDIIELLDWWLGKYHNTSMNQVEEDHPEWFNITDLSKKAEATREFYATYKVTQEQHDEWVKWAKEHIRKKLRLSKAYLDNAWWGVYLNSSPSVINE